MTPSPYLRSEPSREKAELRRLLDAELSLGARLGYVALLLGALAMSGVTVALWSTEPSIPLRTQVAFAVMSGIGFSWVAFAVWVLTRRRVLFARDSIVAGRMAVIFCVAFMAGALALAASTGRAEGYKAAAVGALMLCGASALLSGAHRSHRRLIERRDALARELEGSVQ